MQHSENLVRKFHHRALKVREQRDGRECGGHSQWRACNDRVANEGRKRCARWHPAPDEGNERIDDIGLDAPFQLRLSRLFDTVAPSRLWKRISENYTNAVYIHNGVPHP